MKVGFNARVLQSEQLRGWSRYTINLLAALPAEGIELLLYTDKPLRREHLSRLVPGSYIVRELPSRSYTEFEQFHLARQSRLDDIDLLHCPINFGLPLFGPCPGVLTLHDMIDPLFQMPMLPLRAKLKRAHLQSRLHDKLSQWGAKHIITVSEHAKSDILRVLRRPANSVTAILEAADPTLTAAPPTDSQRVRRKYELHRPFVFYVGGWEERKNLPFLMRAFALAALDGAELILTGGTEPERAAMAQLAARLGVSTARLLGYVPDGDLAALYGEALCFVYPSLYEGFGLQLCEAMSLGCPTLAANCTALPEVLGSGGELFSVHDPGELAALLRRVGHDAAYRAGLSERARHRSTQLTWGRTARQTANVYRMLVG